MFLERHWRFKENYFFNQISKTRWNYLWRRLLFLRLAGFRIYWYCNWSGFKSLRLRRVSANYWNGRRRCNWLERQWFKIKIKYSFGCLRHSRASWKSSENFAEIKCLRYYIHFDWISFRFSICFLSCYLFIESFFQFKLFNNFILKRLEIDGSNSCKLKWEYFK